MAFGCTLGFFGDDVQTMLGDLVVAAGEKLREFSEAFIVVFDFLADFVGQKITAMIDWINKLIDKIASVATGVFSGGGTPGGTATAPGPTIGFRHGGQFKVGGAGGFDSQLVAFKATPGEMVTITPENDMGGGGSTFNINARYADAGVTRQIERALERFSERMATPASLHDMATRGAVE